MIARETIKKWTLALGLSLMSALGMAAQSAPITYQGKLDDAGQPANGQYDFLFKLFQTESGGSPVASEFIVENLQVTGGIFTARLEFTVFPYLELTGRYLEISVRPGASTGAYTTLAPRQELTNAPYAARSTYARDADFLGGIPAAQIVQTNDPRLSDARPPTPGSSNYVQNSTTSQGSTNFNISGTGSAQTLNASTQFNLNGDRVLFVSSGAGNLPTLSNVFAGVGSGASNTSGFRNSFLGRNAGNANTTGAANTFVGTEAGLANQSGSQNSFFGSQAGRASVGSGENSFFGNESGRNTTTGTGNSFFGAVAGANNLTGEFNSYFGNGAGSNPTQGNGNSYFGNSAGSNTFGQFNTFIGTSTGASSLPGGGTFNSLLGSLSTMPGNLDYAAAIGARSSVTQSNSLVLGAINGINGATASTNVGIGTTAPVERLHVVGTARVDGILAIQGTIAPAGAELTIDGNVSANSVNSTTGYRIGNSPFLRSGGGNSSTYAGAFGSGGSDTTVGSSTFGASAGFSQAGGNLYNSFFGFRSGTSTTSGDFNSFFGSGEAGSTGTGYNNTSGRLNSFFGHRAGENNATSSFNAFFGSYAGRLTTGGSNTFVGHEAGDGNVGGSANTVVGVNADVGSGGLQNASAFGFRSFVTTPNSLVLGSIANVNGASASTNVGIGLTNPSSRLHVRADGQDGIKIQHTGTGAFPQLRWTDQNDVFKAAISVGPVADEGMLFFVNGANRFAIRPNGNVGIGTDAPAAKVDVAGGSVYIRNPSSLIITSPNGACWFITVNNAGALGAVSVPCP